ncbi:S-layer homology domain-containing protein [Domibacillus indicus]|uniref:S-layer homology domain-containing protein n=1 Tax=Domibacillus indicus TaxID=1437523 RepID=UPI0006991A73|nr:S-layer homology domain-containing protein [Domibacillus indicus]
MKFSAVAAGAVLSFGMAVSSADAAFFSDVPETNRFYEAIDVLSDSKIISGYSDGTFQPKAEVTRGQAAIFLGRALGLNEKEKSASFSDVHPSSAAAGYIAAAVKAGVISGFSDGTYRPNDPVTRGQTAILIGRAFELQKTADIDFADVSPHSAAYPFIENVTAAGIANGYSNELYRPNLAVTREQFAAFLHRAYAYEPEAEEEDWQDYFLDDGQTASFRGEGIEYASYTARTVWHDKRHVTVYEDNGGTVAARTFRLEEDRVTIIREEAEQYNDYKPAPGELESLAPISVYLKAPLEEGASFDGWTVTDDDAVLNTPLRMFNNVVVLERTEDGAVIRSYFAKRYGEVKAEYKADDFAVTSVIEQISE